MIINTIAGFFCGTGAAFCFGAAAAAGLLDVFPGAGKSVPVYALYSAFRSSKIFTAASISSYK